MHLLLMEICHYSPSTVNQLAVFVVLFIYLLGYGVSNALWGPGKKKKTNQCLGGRFCVAVQFMKCCFYLENI